MFALVNVMKCSISDRRNKYTCFSQKMYMSAAEPWVISTLKNMNSCRLTCHTGVLLCSLCEPRHVKMMLKIMCLSMLTSSKRSDGKLSRLCLMNGMLYWYRRCSKLGLCHFSNSRRTMKPMSMRLPGLGKHANGKSKLRMRCTRMG